MKYFDHLPIEICMMVFDHLITDKSSLGTICKVSHNWKTITQNSYAWKLLINANIGEKTPLALEYVNKAWVSLDKINPIVYAQCVPNDILSNHCKIILAKKFMFSFLGHMDINKNILSVWYHLVFTCNNVQLLQLFQKTFNITAYDVRADDNRALRVACDNNHLEVLKYLHIQFNLTVDDARDYHNDALLNSCENGNLEILKYLHKGFGLTIDDVRYDHNYALRIACEFGHLEVVEYLHKEFDLDDDDARDWTDYALRMACNNGHLSIIQYLHTEFGLDDDNARASDNCALRWACEYGHRAIIDYLHEEFELTAADALDSMSWLRKNVDKYNIDYLCKVFGLTADEI